MNHEFREEAWGASRRIWWSRQRHLASIPKQGGPLQGFSQGSVMIGCVFQDVLSRC